MPTYSLQAAKKLRFLPPCQLIMSRLQGDPEAWQGEE